jgi:hypothetical protein
MRGAGDDPPQLEQPPFFFRIDRTMNSDAVTMTTAAAA